MAAIDKYFDLMSAIWALEVHARDENVSDGDIRAMVQSVAAQVRGQGDIVVRVPLPKTVPMFDDEEQPAWAQEAQDEMEHAMELDNGGR